MKRNSKFFAVVCTCAAAVGGVAILASNQTTFLTKAQNPEYSVKWTEAPTVDGENVTFKTKLGNEVKFATTNMVESTAMLSLGVNGTLANLPYKDNTGIGQIKSITVDYTINDETASYNPDKTYVLSLDYGYENGKYFNTVNLGKTLSFNEGNCPSFIRINNISTNVINFKEISLVYGCTAHDTSTAAKDFTLTFDQAQEGVYDWSKVGEVKDGGLTITKSAKVKLANPIVIKPNTPWTLQFKTKATSTAPNGTILTEGENESMAFINLPDAKTNNTKDNGFTIRDKDKTVGYLFKKDTAKVNDINTFVMTYDGKQSIRAYQNGVEITGDNIVKQGSKPARNINVTFKYLFSGFKSDYDYIGTIYHLQYNTRVLSTNEFIK